MQDNSKAVLTDRFVTAVDYLVRQVHTGGLDDWEGLDMTIPQIKTLVMLERVGPSRMGSIASYLGRALSATTTVVDRLVEKGLVDRAWDPSDRRVVICKLTDRGVQALEKFWRVRREEVQLVVDALDADELQIVVQGLELLCAKQKCFEKTAPAMQTAE